MDSAQSAIRINRPATTRDQLKQLENDLWSAADNLRANSDLKASEYSTPVLGLIFLKFADINYRRHEHAIQAEFDQLKGTRREKPLAEIAIARCGFYLPSHARYHYLLNLPEDADLAKAIEAVMESIEHYKPELNGSLPKEEYYRLTRTPETRELPANYPWPGNVRELEQALRRIILNGRYAQDALSASTAAPDQQDP
ncbi:Type I restriction-modification system methyltransferase subunit [Thiorhodovibrio winogradskyi]|uniref:Type I restriction-modification system methyltransferase subunit n=1 Tax=Thiorhodovibrio winogradskyi TaxID=77007 RepID=A0ABZ0SH19_9GAMM|nr:type I restriction-modification system subunit M N-terminal domain-containing protein [Thiorhodovibrio winogradskyi]